MSSTPFHGMRFVVTRPLERGAELGERLKNLGATTIIAPVITVEPIGEDLITRLHNELNNYDLVVFTSVNGVMRVLTPEMTRHWPATLKIAAIGPATTEDVRRRGIPVSTFNDGVTSADLVKTLGDLRGKRVLLPQGDRADKAFAKGLEQAGAVVTPMTVYRTVENELDPDILAELEKGWHVVIFHSPSAVRAFEKVATQRGPCVCVGPTTAAAADVAGFGPVTVAKRPTTDGVLLALKQAIAPILAAMAAEAENAE
jgi:uroporphyrinogen-III synthase